MDIVELVNKYGFPIVMAVGMGFIIKYVWEWATKEVKPVISNQDRRKIGPIAYRSVGGIRQYGYKRKARPQNV